MIHAHFSAPGVIPWQFGKSLILSLEDGPEKAFYPSSQSKQKKEKKSSPSPRNRLQKWSNQVKYLETWRSTYHKTAYYGKEK